MARVALGKGREEQNQDMESDGNCSALEESSSWYDLGTSQSLRGNQKCENMAPQNDSNLIRKQLEKMYMANRYLAAVYLFVVASTRVMMYNGRLCQNKQKKKKIQ